jgi:hypothetical protein
MGALAKDSEWDVQGVRAEIGNVQAKSSRVKGFLVEHSKDNVKYCPPHPILK